MSNGCKNILGVKWV